MFNKESIDFLKSINRISNSIVLTYPVTTGRSEGSDIAYKFDLSKFDNDEFPEIGIYDLAGFLGIFSMFEPDRKVQIVDNVVTVSDSTTSVNYLTTAPSVLTQFTYGIQQFEKTNTFPTVLEMPLTVEDIRKLKIASSNLKELDTAVIRSLDDEVTLELSVLEKFKKSSNSFKIRKPVSGTKNFSIGVSLETISKIPQVDYTLIIKYNETRDAYRIILKTDAIVGFEMNLAVKVI